MNANIHTVWWAGQGSDSFFLAPVNDDDQIFLSLFEAGCDVTQTEVEGRTVFEFKARPQPKPEENGTTRTKARAKKKAS